MQKPTAILAAVLAVSVPVVVASSSLADVVGTTPTSTSTSPTSTSTTPTSPYAPAATPTPTPKPTATPAPAAPLPNPAPTLLALQTSVETGLKGFSYTDLLAGKATINFGTPAAGTYVVTVAYRKPGQKYRSVAKGAVSTKAAGTTTSVLLKPNSYAPSTVRYAKHKKTTKLQVTYSYELSNRTVINEESLTVNYK